MPLFALLIAAPLVEIAVFILVGRQIGVAATLLVTLATAVAGVLLLRFQGLAALERIRAELAARCLPARPLADAAMIAVAGLLLVIPGLVTDALGFLLFIPAVRTAVWRLSARRVGASGAWPQAGLRRPYGMRRRAIDLKRHECEVRTGERDPERESPSLPRNRSA
jgi:UPF0716 protein FxsA